MSSKDATIRNVPFSTCLNTRYTLGRLLEFGTPARIAVTLLLQLEAQRSDHAVKLLAVIELHAYRS
jgi:hypothetical protein